MFDLRVLIWIVAPVAPLVAALVLLNVIDAGQSNFVNLLPATTSLIDSGRDLTFFSHYVSYLGVALFHVAACMTAIVVLLIQLKGLPRSARDQALIVAGAILVLLAIVGAIARTDQFDGGLNFAYRYTCAALNAAGLGMPVFPKSCFKGQLSAFAVLSLVPLMAGLVAAAMAAAVASTAYRPLTTQTKDIDAELDRRAQLVALAFKSTSLVMVTSVLAQVQFYRLPLPLIKTELDLNLMTGYAQSMTLFWGVVFSLTIIAVFGPGALMLQRHLRDLRGSIDMPDIPSGLDPSSVRQQMVNILTSLAPLLIGASGSILETISGAL